MSIEFETYGSPKEWLGRAKSDLILAKNKIKGVIYEDLCFHAQQTAEKSIKAVLIYYKIPFPKTHSISVLLKLLPNSIILPEEIRKSTDLTFYATTARYPADIKKLTSTEWKKCVEKAMNVYVWAEKIIDDLSASGN